MTTHSPSGTASRQGSVTIWRALSALALLAMAGIHLYLVAFSGFGGLLGTLFILNGIGGIVLAIAVLALRGSLLSLATVLSLLFLAGTLVALLLALTTGLFGIREVIDGELVVTTIVVEAIGTVILAVTTAVVLRSRPAA
jgi:hypothetical protein